MKLAALTIFISLLFACTSHQHVDIQSFWANFQKAVAANDPEKVADMALFPLGVSDGFAEKVDSNGMTRLQFLDVYDQIFDEKVKITIAQTAASDLTQYTPPKEAALQALNLPANTVVYNFTVTYVFDEGLETQTESVITFYFLKQKNGIKLAYILVVG